MFPCLRLEIDVGRLRARAQGARLALRLSTGAGGALFLSLGFGCVIPISSSNNDGGAGSDSGNTQSDGGGIDGERPATMEGGGLTDAPSPQGSWINVTGNLAGLASECGSVSGVFAKPDEDLLIAGIALKGLWGSRDGGNSWQALGSGAMSATITNRPTAMAFDPKNTMRYWESGIYNGGGVYVTNDDGQSIVQLGTVHHIDVVSVDFTDPARRTLLADGHEQPQTVYKSTDGGITWSNVGGGLPAGTFCSSPLIIDAQTYLIGCNVGPSVGIYRTNDGAMTWTRMTTAGGGAPALLASDQSIYWVAPNGAMTRSVDAGVAWTDVLGPGVIVGQAGHLTSGAPVELPDGRIAALGMETVIVSADRGSTWKPVTGPLPMSNTEDLHGVVYSSKRKAFYVWHNTCGNSAVPVPNDAIMRFDFDYQTH